MTAILIATLAMTGLAMVFGAALTYAAERFPPNEEKLIKKINALLPQTQCGQCGFPGCKPYATAMARSEAPINQCPPGGQQTIYELADLLGSEPLPLNPEHGFEKPVPLVAFIREAECIGCTKCIQACPVDAILGAAKLMHTVIADECTGCDLCVEPCPVDCIDMIPASAISLLSLSEKNPYRPATFTRIPVSNVP